MLESDHSRLVRRSVLAQSREQYSPPRITLFTKQKDIYDQLRQTPGFQELCTKGKERLVDPVESTNWQMALGQAYGSLYEFATILILQETYRGKGTILDGDKTFDIFRRYYPKAFVINHGFGQKSLFLPGKKGSTDIKVTPPDAVRVVRDGRHYTIPEAFECTMVEDSGYFTNKAERILDGNSSLLTDAQYTFVVVSNLHRRIRAIKEEIHNIGLSKEIPNAEKRFAFLPTPFDHHSFLDFVRKELQVGTILNQRRQAEEQTGRRKQSCYFNNPRVRVGHA